MRCARCGWPVDEARTVSSHVTSEGWVRYRRCVCGAVFVQQQFGQQQFGQRQLWQRPGTTNGTRAR